MINVFVGIHENLSCEEEETHSSSNKTLFSLRAGIICSIAHPIFTLLLPWWREDSWTGYEGGEQGSYTPRPRSPLTLLTLAHRQYFPKNSFEPRSMHSKHRICMSTFQIGSEGKLNIFLVVRFNWLDSIKQFQCCAMISPILWFEGVMLWVLKVRQCNNLNF